jgi:hypothetical protein
MFDTIKLSVSNAKSSIDGYILYSVYWLVIDSNLLQNKKELSMNKELLKDLLKTALVALVVVFLFNAAFGGKECKCNTTAPVVAEQKLDSAK